jgi:hypothetical protein
LFKQVECLPDGIANVKAMAGAAQITVTIPAYVSLQLINWVEVLPLNQTFGQTERHRCGDSHTLYWIDLSQLLSQNTLENIIAQKP